MNNKLSSQEVMNLFRNLGEIQSIMKDVDNNMINWVMRVGESRNILNNALREFDITKDVMKQLEHDIPNFHKQPGAFRELEQRIGNLTYVLHQVVILLSYATRLPLCHENCSDECTEDCRNSRDIREDSDRDYDEDDE